MLLFCWPRSMYNDAVPDARGQHVRDLLRIGQTRARDGIRKDGRAVGERLSGGHLEDAAALLPATRFRLRTGNPEPVLGNHQRPDRPGTCPHRFGYYARDRGLDTGFTSEQAYRP